MRQFENFGSDLLTSSEKKKFSKNFKKIFSLWVYYIQILMIELAESACLFI